MIKKLQERLQQKLDEVQAQERKCKELQDKYDKVVKDLETQKLLDKVV